MKALTLWDPWASLIMIGVKRLETRPWRLPASMVGQRIAIHASKKVPKAVFEDAMRNQYIRSALSLDPDFTNFHPGCVLGTVELGDCYSTEDLIADDLNLRERAFGDYTPGRYAFELRNVVRFETPVPALGRQKFWNWDSVDGK
jgi:hypothetical protein